MSPTSATRISPAAAKAIRSPEGAQAGFDARSQKRGAPKAPDSPRSAR